MRRSLNLCLALAVMFPFAAEAAEHGYVGFSTTDSLVVLDLDAGTALSPSISLLPEANYPYDATILPDGSEVWICGAVGDGVVVVDTATQGVIANIDLGVAGEYPVNIAFDASGTTAYVSSRDGNAVVLVDVATHTPTGVTVATTGSPGKGRVWSAGGTLFIVEWYGSELYAIDTGSLAVTSAVVGSSLWDLAIHPSGAPLYAIDRGTDQVHLVDPDTLTVTTSVAVGDDPWGLDITPDGSTLFIACEDGSSVSVIDTATNLVIETIPLAADADPRDVDISADGAFAYVPNGSVTGDDGVVVIDTATLTIADIITVSGDSNGNVVAVAPEPLVFIFTDGFESGDTSAWSSTVP
jgi:YVTN family beta-propeller protein